MENVMNHVESVSSEIKSMTEIRENVYAMMSGLINLDKNPIPETIYMKYVENEYAEERECGKLYAEAYQIKLRLFERLESYDDSEVERLIECFCEMQDILCRKMFDYGWLFARCDFLRL